ncbi:MAG TPA: hypothetical protein VKM55_27860 [Candidatus Lokiarchaeia archaeon]|nr:hypothetical protein [Candidatus Lokiarchaeia archaeon]
MISLDKRSLEIKIIHEDSTKQEFNQRDCDFPVNNWDAGFRRFCVQAVSETYLNKPCYQGTDLDTIGDELKEFLSLEMWNYEIITITHEFKTNEMQENQANLETENEQTCKSNKTSA